ncbi:unnamed protein product [Linum tenue]|uniref:Uncharacterized protein n=1 Tax=Linum tenue TaxID=586396 RepID=A0AAV0LF86_9ROSI|nr:unnamed protein product [Linum tenue]
MEKVMEELKDGERKQRDLRKRLEEMHSQASSVLDFSLDWKDLELHYESIKEELVKQAAEIAFQEKEIVEARDRVVVDLRAVEGFFKQCKQKESELGSLQMELSRAQSELLFTKEQLGVVVKEIQVKEKKLGVVEQRVVECGKALEGKEKELGFAKMSLDQLRVEVEGTEQQYGKVKQLVEKETKELESRNKQVEEVERLLSDCSSQLQLKKTELEDVKESIRNWNAESKSKENQLAELEKRTTDCIVELKLRQNELDMRNEDLERARNLVKKQNYEFLSKKTSLDSMEELIKKFEEDFARKEFEYKEMIKEKEQRLASLEESIRKSSHSKEKVEDCVMKKNLEAKQAGLSFVQAAMEAKKRELQLKEKLDSRQKLLQEREQQLNSSIGHSQRNKAPPRNTRSAQEKEQQHNWPWQVGNFSRQEQGNKRPRNKD